MLPEEAELATVFARAWRYTRLATANQLQAMASDRGLDFERICRGVVLSYPSAADLPPAGADPALLPLDEVRAGQAR
jgi:hypothetical protein